MPLTSGRSYYAFGIYAQQSSGSTMYVPFDDFEIYTASPYATYTPEPTNYPEGTFSGTFRFRNNNKQYNIVIAITKSSIGQVAVILDGETNINATGITVSGTSVTIPTSGTYDSKSVGTITATYSASENKLNSISSDGTLKINSSYSSATLVSSSDTFFDCDGSTSDLQSQFTRRYRSMGATLWDLDTSNSDRVTSSTLHHAAGVGAVALRPYHSGQTAIALANDYSGTVAIKHISFWVYNPSASDIRIRCWVYDAANFDKDHANELEATASAGHMDAKAGSWTYIHACHADGNKQIVTFDAKNFQIGDLSGSGAKLVFDNIIIY